MVGDESVGATPAARDLTDRLEESSVPYAIALALWSSPRATHMPLKSRVLLSSLGRYGRFKMLLECIY